MCNQQTNFVIQRVHQEGVATHASRSRRPKVSLHKRNGFETEDLHRRLALAPFSPETTTDDTRKTEIVLVSADLNE